jgi:hypothetical protein
MEFDGCFPEASEVLTDEEYFSKIEFDQRLLSITRSKKMERITGVRVTTFTRI